MTIDSPAVLLVQNDVVPGREAGFDAWYLDDHMPERIETPGFRRARRWRAVQGSPRDFSLYEIDSVAVMASPPYRARLAAPTAGTRANMDAFIGMLRSVCNVRAAEGFADGGHAAFVPLLPPLAPASVAAFLSAAAWRPDAGSGVLARALLDCDADASRSDTVESRLRREPDRHIAAGAWIEAASPEQAETAMRAALAAVSDAGLRPGQPVLLRMVATFLSRHRRPDRGP